MSYAATGTGSIVLNVASVTEQRNMQLSLLAWYDKCCAAELNLCGAFMKVKIEREYQARKQKMQRYSDPFWWLTVVFKEVGFTEVDRNPGDEALSIELSYYHNYDEHAILELLEALLPYTSEGCIPTAVRRGITGVISSLVESGLSRVGTSAMARCIPLLQGHITTWRA